MLLFDGSHVNLWIAFLGGVITFFASCLLPLVPVYLAHMANTVYDHKPRKREILLNSIIFTAGFIFVFVILGLSATSLGFLLRRKRVLLQKLGGALLITVGLFLLRIFKPGFLLKERHFDLIVKHPKAKLLNSFLFGLTFGFAWSPCVGPVLAVILFWASQAETALTGASLLFVYGLGIGLPFILIGLFFEKYGKNIMSRPKIAQILNIVASMFIILTGITLLFGKYQLLAGLILRFLPINSLSI